MPEQPDIAAVARKHGLSQGAGEALFAALVSGRGAQAQFSHPDLGGMGQWSGGMTMIGDMFNDALKAKVSGFCQDMAGAARKAREAEGTRAGSWQHQSQGPGPDRESVKPASPWATHGATHDDRWWPADLGSPASSGAQNGMSYACFPDKRRLAISRDGRVTIYDTGEHRLSGFSQQQSAGGDLSFSGQNGPVALDQLKVVDR